MLDPSAWRGVFSAIVSDVRTKPWYYLLALAGLPILVGARIRMVRRVLRLGRQAEKPTHAVFRETAEATAASVLGCVTLPAALWFLSWRLDGSALAGEFERAVASGLSRMSIVLFTFGWARQVIRPGGLAECHFEWLESSLRAARPLVRWMTVVGALSVLTISLMEGLHDERYAESLGRLTFVVAMAAFVWFGHAMLRPRKGPIAQGLD